MAFTEFKLTQEQLQKVNDEGFIDHRMIETLSYLQKCGWEPADDDSLWVITDLLQSMILQAKSRDLVRVAKWVQKKHSKEERGY